MPREIPIEESGPFITQTTDLDGTDFVFTFRFNEREQRWYMDLRTPDGDDVHMGVKVVTDWLLLRLLVDQTNRPRGEIYAVDATGSGLDARLGDLGTRVRLIYFDEGELG